jgi:ribosomal protein S18 acetylase RimI-like enzyme
MMQPILIHDKEELEKYLLRYPQLNFYHLGDLDDFFWPYTSWFALKEDDQINALILMYSGIRPVTVLAIENDNHGGMLKLLENSLPLLPGVFYAHLSAGLEQVLSAYGYQIKLHGEHYKMALSHPEKLELIDTTDVEQLSSNDLDEMLSLYKHSYPGNWFDPRMLETGQYTGLRDKNGQLVSVAGIHVYSPEYKIAALGNITTNPKYRGQGLAKKVTAGLCKLLLTTSDSIGLNVRSDNSPAIQAYHKIGFEVVGKYNEWMVNPPS